MYEKKTTLHSLKSKTEKVNDLLTNIPTNDFMELNNLIYAEAKLVCEKIGVSPEDHRQKVKTRERTQIIITDKKTTTTSKSTKTEH